MEFVSEIRPNGVDACGRERVQEVACGRLIAVTSSSHKIRSEQGSISRVNFLSIAMSRL